MSISTDKYFNIKYIDIGDYLDKTDDLPRTEHSELLFHGLIKDSLVRFDFKYDVWKSFKNILDEYNDYIQNKVNYLKKVYDDFVNDYNTKALCDYLSISIEALQRYDLDISYTNDDCTEGHLNDFNIDYKDIEITDILDETTRYLYNANLLRSQYDTLINELSGLCSLCNDALKDNKMNKDQYDLYKELRSAVRRDINQYKKEKASKDSDSIWNISDETPYTIYDKIASDYGYIKKLSLDELLDLKGMSLTD